MRRTLIAILLLAAAAIGGWKWRSQRNAALTPDAIPETASVIRGDLDLRVAATGRVISNLDIEIKSKASGKVQTLPFDVSDAVKKGELLVELDPVDEQRELTMREAEVEAASARLEQARQSLKIAQTQLQTGTLTADADLLAARQRYEQARSNLDRHEEMFLTRVINQQELDAARTEERQARSALESAQARVQELATLGHTVALRQEEIRLAQAQLDSAKSVRDFARQRLDETKIYAPMDGVVTERRVAIGQIIASGISNVGGGTPLLTISDLSRIFVVASVDESDIGNVVEEMPAVITVDAFPGKRFEGKVERIGAKGVNSNNVVTFEVWIEAQGEGVLRLKPEMTANVEILAARRENALLLPAGAVQHDTQGYFVELASGAAASRRRAVNLGISDGIVTEILEGVGEGETFVVRGGLRSQWSNLGKEAGPGLSQSMQRTAWGIGRKAGAR